MALFLVQGSKALGIGFQSSQSSSLGLVLEGSRVYALGLRVLGFRGLGFRGLGFQGLGFRLEGLGCGLAG